jgi:HEAT repeat protein
MPDNNGPSRLEIFKTFSTFFSSVIIASASIIVTLTYNKQQFEITQKQAASQMEITRIKEITNLIPKLGSENASERKFSAITLSLYGKSAVPALIAILEDENIDVRVASSKALALIGDPAVLELEETFRDRRNSINLRAMSIFTLGRLKSVSAVQLAMEAVQDNSENKIVRKDAATALGMLKDARSIPALLKAIQSTTNTALVENSVWAIGEIGEKEVNEKLLSMLDHHSVQVRIQAIWAMAKLKDTNTENLLLNIIEKDNSKEVRDAATNAIEWMK